MRIAYVAPSSCGTGHSVRGVALLRAAERAGIRMAAFGPPPQLVAPSRPVGVRVVREWDLETQTITVRRDMRPPVETLEVDCSSLTAAGFTAADDWQQLVLRFKPNLVVGDMHYKRLADLMGRLECPGWLLVRWMPCGWLNQDDPMKDKPGLRGDRRPAVDNPGWRIQRWERVISTEPLSETIVGTTHAIQPIVVSNPDEVVADSPYNGQDVDLAALRNGPDTPFPVAPYLTKVRSLTAAAGYNAYWESVWLGYRDRTTWLRDDNTEQQHRIEIGGEMTANGADELMEMILKWDEHRHSVRNRRPGGGGLHDRRSPGDRAQGRHRQLPGPDARDRSLQPRPDR